MRRPAAGLILAALLFAACSAPPASPTAEAVTAPPSPQPTRPPNTPTPALALSATPAGFPAGAYAVTITAQDAPQHPASLNGPWYLNFRLNGNFDIDLGDQQVVTGTYTAAGATLTLAETGGPLACFRSSESWRSATYTWALDGIRLILDAVNDPCLGRKLALTAHPLDPAP
jgi:hypothetical protein